MRFSRYELLSRLGAGGMGEVWRARDHDLQREVAVKFLPERFAADPTRLGRFAQEARAASSLNHPNIVTIHEIGQTSGLPFIVMELVEGQTLREVVLAHDKRPLPARRLLEIGAQVADGLAKAHAAGIVHRDLKPENAMVTADGFVKILDFGLAKLRSDGSGETAPGFDSAAPTWPESPSPQTAAGAVLGTAGYMSPEQARGKPVDYRSDQFTLGAILYEMATGRQAFGRETPAQTIAAIIEDPPEPLSSLNPALPTPVRWLIERCLAKDPEERYASTLDLARDLRGLREHLPEAGGSGSQPPASGRPRRRNVALAAGASLTLVLVAGLVAVSPSRRDRLASLLGLRPVPREKHVAVLPFRAASPDPEDQFRADGLAETVAARLSQLERSQGALRVVPLVDLRQAGVASAEAARRVFGVTLVVTGSLQRAGERLRLTASLVDAASLRQLRAVGPRDYARDDLRLQDEVVALVAGMMELPLGREDERALGEGRTEVGGAYALYARARGHIQRFERVENVETAVTLLQQALEQDPGYALAYAALGEAYWRLFELTKRPELVDLARDNCRKALALNDLLAPVYVTLGIIQRGTGRNEEAASDLRRALDRDPRSADALRELGRAEASLGRADEAEAAYRRALALRPSDWAAHNYLGALLVASGRLDEAAAEFRRVTELVPDNPRGFTNLGVVALRRGRPEEAEAAYRRSVDVRPSPAGFNNLGTALFHQGRYEAAAAAFEEAVRLNDRDHGPWLNTGRARYYAPGGREGAREALERAVQLLEAARRVNPRDPEVLVGLADAHAMLGHRAEALAFADRAVGQGVADGAAMAVAAGVYATAGDRDRALEWVGRALRAGYSRWEIERDPVFESLRRDPRFPPNEGKP
jgi:serine/threonine-protein kinase